jgi:acetyl esterase/lipase
MRRLTSTLPALVLALFVCVGLPAGCSGQAEQANDGQEADATPLWAYTPETISPEWGVIFAKGGQNRDWDVPAADDVEGWKVFQVSIEEEFEPLADEKAAKFGVTYKEYEIAGIPVVEVVPAELVRTDKIGVYTHGGGYVLFSAKSLIHFAMFFAAETGLRVIAIDYILAPHSKWQDTTSEVVSVFEALAEQGFAASDIVLFGDSAGGGLAATSTLKMRDLGMEMPAALILWSPWADVGEIGDTYITLRDAEVFYTYETLLAPSALAYADAKDHKHPYVSPVYGDFTQGFPPTLIQGGTKEILYEGMPHVFVGLLPETAECQAAMAKVEDWVSEHVLVD